MKKRSFTFAWLIPLMLVLIAGPSFAGTAKSSHEGSVPELISIMDYPIGSTGYAQVGLMADAILRKYGVKTRCIPAAVNIARMIGLREGKAEFAIQGGGLYLSSEALAEYSARSWGPQPIRVAWLPSHTGTTAIVRGTSDIKTLADLKGKKIAWIPGSHMNRHVESHLAFAGLTWDDVKKVKMASPIAAIRGIIDGTVDMACGSNTTTINYEIEASPYGIRFLQMPFNDKEGWARAKAVSPYYIPFKATIGPGLSEEKPSECAGLAFPAVICYPNLDDDIAYFMTKAIHTSYPIMAKSNKIMKECWKLEKTLYLFEQGSSHIFHAGSVRYFKEIGVWKPNWDKLQEKRISYQNKLRKLWDSVIAEADEKGINKKDFPSYWLKKRAEIFGK